MSTESSERIQAETHTSSSEADGRPIFKTENPATGEPGKAYEGHTLKEALAIAGEVSGFPAIGGGSALASVRSA